MRLKYLKLSFLAGKLHAGLWTSKAIIAAHHVVDCIDGRKEPPKWLHRTHRVFHLAYLVTAVIFLHWLHEYVIIVMAVLEASTFFLGATNREIEEIDPE